MPSEKRIKRFLRKLGQAMLDSNLRLLDWIAKQKGKGRQVTNYFSVYLDRDISSILYYENYQYMEFKGKQFRVPLNMIRG